MTCSTFVEAAMIILPIALLQVFSQDLHQLNDTNNNNINYGNIRIGIQLVKEQNSSPCIALQEMIKNHLKYLRNGLRIGNERILR